LVFVQGALKVSRAVIRLGVTYGGFWIISPHLAAIGRIKGRDSIRYVGKPLACLSCQ
jgi:hypothetical protein